MSQPLQVAVPTAWAGALEHDAPFLIEKLVKDRVVDTADVLAAGGRGLASVRPLHRRVRGVLRVALHRRVLNDRARRLRVEADGDSVDLIGPRGAVLFGIHDSWAPTPWRATVLRKGEVLALTSGLDVIRLEEREYDGTNVLGQSKHWHTFRCIARKRS